MRGAAGWLLRPMAISGTTVSSERRNLRLTHFDGPMSLRGRFSGGSQPITSELESPSSANREERPAMLRQRAVGGESDDETFRGGKAGLAKFRNTEAAFKNFQVGTNLAAPNPTGPDSEFAAVAAKISSLSGLPDSELAATLRRQPDASRALLNERARALERQAAELREIAARPPTISSEDLEAFARAGRKGRPLHAAILLARLDNPEIGSSRICGNSPKWPTKSNRDCRAKRRRGQTRHLEKIPSSKRFPR